MLELVQVPLAVALARRLQTGEQRRRQLLDLAVRASDAERRRIAATCTTASCRTSPGSPTSWTPHGSAAAERQPDERDAILAEAARRLRDCVRSLRTMLLDIYPPNLPRRDSASALVDLAAVWSTDELTVQSHLEDFGEPPPHVAALLYRAAQEAIRNAVRHSRASRVDLSSSRHDDGIWELVVDDDGQGMAAGRSSTHREEGHLGLHALGELLADAGGSLALHSAPDAGTRVEIKVPAPMIRVLVADDHAVVRRGLATLLATAPDLELVGTA